MTDEFSEYRKDAKGGCERCMKILLYAAAVRAHEANREYCESIGDYSQKHWHDSPKWQQESALSGVEGVIAGNTPEQSHETWLEHKKRDGWMYGSQKNADTKRHPCMVPYDQLPEEQKRKDHIFVSSVNKVLLGV